MSYVITRKHIATVVLSLGCAFAIAGQAAADSASASLGAVVTGTDQNCMRMFIGRMQNLCARTVGWEVALPIRTTGAKAVEITVPASTPLPVCSVYREARNGTDNLMIRSFGLIDEPPVKVMRFSGLSVPNPNYVLNATCQLNQNQWINTVSWNG